jgi:cytochrome c
MVVCSPGSRNNSELQRVSLNIISGTGLYIRFWLGTRHSDRLNPHGFKLKDLEMKDVLVKFVFCLIVLLSGQSFADPVNRDQPKDLPPEAKELGCVSCHLSKAWNMGPDWYTISKMYKGATQYEYNGKMYPVVEGMVLKISKGGNGHWGTMPMVAMDLDGSKHDKIKKLVIYILNLDKSGTH